MRVGGKMDNGLLRFNMGLIQFRRVTLRLG